jgi:hypothetical protein
LLATCWLATPGLAREAVPIIAKISGYATLSQASGASHELLAAEPLRSEATVTTALDSLVAVNLDKVGQTRLGPQTKATVAVRSGALWFTISSRQLCVQSESQNLDVQAGTLQISPAAPKTSYDLAATPDGLEIAVFQGGIVIGGPHVAATTVYAGGAIRSNAKGDISDAPISSLVGDFAKLQCPDPNVVAEVLPSPTPEPAVSNPGHRGVTGIIIGTILGLGAIAAAVSHGGGSNAPQALSVAPSSLTFTNVGVTQSVSVSEPGYLGSFSKSKDSCNGIVTVALPATSGPQVSANVTSQAAGDCQFQVSDDRGQSATVSVSVGPFGVVQTRPASLNATVGGANSTIQVSETGYSGTFAADASACSSIASITPSSGSSYTVSPQAVGNCPAVFSDDHGQSGRTLIFVTAGGIMISPQAIQLSSSGDTHSFVASESAPAVFSATSSNLAVATVTLIAQTLTAATFSVTAVGSGKATVSVTDTLGGAGDVSVGVAVATLDAKHRAARTAPGKRGGGTSISRSKLQTVPRPTWHAALAGPQALTLSRSTSRAVTVADQGYAGPLSVTTSNSSVAAARAIPSTAAIRTVIITGRGVGSATIHVADGRGGQLLIQVTVMAPLPLTQPVKPNRRPSSPWW